MNSANAYLTVGGLGVDVVYKDIKNLHISVYPPMGRVRVAAPHRLDEEAIRLAIVERLPWIKKQRRRLLNAERQTERQMVSGETHYVWGERYRLDASRVGRSNVSIQGKDPLADCTSRLRHRRASTAFSIGGIDGSSRPHCHRCWTSGSRSSVLKSTRLSCAA